MGTMKRTKGIQLTSAEKDEQLRRNLLYRVLATSILGSRTSYGGTQTFGGLRDVSSALGYPLLDGIKYADYYYRFRRQDVANVIITKPVESSWERFPVLHAWEDKEDTFRYAWDDFEKKNRIYSILQRADVISGIGRYGVLLMGLNDGADSFAVPVTSASELLYLQPFSEDNATIKSFVIDKNNPRFGQPEFYSLKLNDNPGLTGVSTFEIIVHHSRIIHIADNLVESNIYGMPRLEKAFNRLLNLELIVGGSAEMFWQGAFPGLAFQAKDGFTISETQLTDLQEEIKNYVHQMERYMRLQGMDVKSLAPIVADPSKHVDVQMKMISIATGIPKRILEGSERGELSSDQDSQNWAKKCDNRRKTYIEPFILRMLIDRLNELGIFKTPDDGYTIEWPDLQDPSEKDRAEVGRIRSEAISKYTSSPDAQLIISFESFLEEIMELSPEKVERIMEESKNIVPTEPDGGGDDEIETLK